MREERERGGKGNEKRQETNGEGNLRGEREDVMVRRDKGMRGNKGGRGERRERGKYG